MPSGVKEERDLRGRVVVCDFKGEGRQFTWRWKGKCLVNTCLLSHL